MASLGSNWRHVDVSGSRSAFPQYGKAFVLRACSQSIVFRWCLPWRVHAQPLQVCSFEVELVRVTSVWTQVPPIPGAQVIYRG